MAQIMVKSTQSVPLTQKGWYLFIYDAFGAIWMHYSALQRYIVKTSMCGYQQFLDISLCPLQPTKQCNFWMVS